MLFPLRENHFKWSRFGKIYPKKGFNLNSAVEVDADA